MPIIFKGAIMFKDKCGVVNEKMSAVFHFQWKLRFTNGHLISNFYFKCFAWSQVVVTLFTRDFSSVKLLNQKRLKNDVHNSFIYLTPI